MSLPTPKGRKDILIYQPSDLQVITDPEDLLYDRRAEEPVDKKLMKSIAAKGIVQPIFVRSRGTEIVVVAGRRRVKAARELAKKKPVPVPCIMLGPDPAHQYMVMVSENNDRKDESPVDRALKMQKARTRLHMTEDRIAAEWNCTERTVRNYLGLLHLCAAVQGAVDAGDITITAALQLRSFSEEEQERRLQSLLRRDKAGPVNRDDVRLDAGRPVAPKMGTLRKIIRDPETSKVVSPEVMVVLRWVAGADMSAEEGDALKGLLGIVERIAAEKKKKSGASNLVDEPSKGEGQSRIAEVENAALVG